MLYCASGAKTQKYSRVNEATRLNYTNATELERFSVTLSKAELQQHDWQNANNEYQLSASTLAACFRTAMRL